MPLCRFKKQMCKSELWIFFCDSIDVNFVDKNVIARILLQIIVEQYMSILLAIKMAAQNLASVRGWQVARI